MFQVTHLANMLRHYLDKQLDIHHSFASFSSRRR